MNKDESYLLDLAHLCQTILKLTENMTKAEFKTDERTQLAILYEITIIGEVVKRLSSEFRTQHTAIEWRKISGMRDRLVHDYDQVNLSLIWEVIQTKIPELLAFIKPLLPVQS